LRLQQRRFQFISFEGAEAERSGKSLKTKVQVIYPEDYPNKGPGDLSVGLSIIIELCAFLSKERSVANSRQKMIPIRGKKKNAVGDFEG